MKITNRSLSGRNFRRQPTIGLSGGSTISSYPENPVFESVTTDSLVATTATLQNAVATSLISTTLEATGNIYSPNVDCQDLSVSSSLTTNTFATTGNSVLKNTSATVLNVSGATTLATATISGVLNVSGKSNLHKTDVDGDLNVYGTASSIALVANACSVVNTCNAKVMLSDLSEYKYSITGTYLTSVDFTYDPLLHGTIISVNRGLSPYVRTITLPSVSAGNYDGLQFSILKQGTVTQTVKLLFSGFIFEPNNTGVLAPYTLLSATQYRATIVVVRDAYYVLSRV